MNDERNARVCRWLGIAPRYRISDDDTDGDFFFDTEDQAHGFIAKVYLDGETVPIFTVYPDLSTPDGFMRVLESLDSNNADVEIRRSRIKQAPRWFSRISVNMHWAATPQEALLVACDELAKAALTKSEGR